MYVCVFVRHSDMAKMLSSWPRGRIFYHKKLLNSHIGIVITIYTWLWIWSRSKETVLLLLYHLQQARKKKKRLSTRKKSKKNKLVTYPTIRDIPFPVCALLPSPFHDSQQNGLRIEKWIVFVYELNGGGSMVLLRFTLFIWDSARTIAHSRWPSLCSNARINQNMVQRYGLPD